jgi:hypothetical protein
MKLRRGRIRRIFTEADQSRYYGRTLCLNKFTIVFLIFTTTACTNLNPAERLLTENIPKVAPTPTGIAIESIQINQSSVLPPYGLRVAADTAALQIRVGSENDDPTQRLADLTQAIDSIYAQAAQDERVAFAASAMQQAGGSSRDSYGSVELWNADSSAVILTLTTSLAPPNDSLLKSLATFNNFLAALTLPEGVTVQALSIEPEISNPELYRPQLIAKVYQELAAVQAKYGPAVKFQIPICTVA